MGRARRLVRGDAVDWASNASSELQILGHDGHALGVNRAKVAVLEKVHQKVLRRLL